MSSSQLYYSSSSTFKTSYTNTASSSAFPSKTKTRHFISLKTPLSSSSSSPFPSLYSISTTGNRFPHSISASRLEHEASPESSFQTFFRSVLSSMERVYLDSNPTAKAVLELVKSADEEQICYDHLAFRTFGINGHGIDALATLFLDYGYTQREELRFPAKKVRAYWYSPPSVPQYDGGSGVNGPLPRVFISELIVDQLSSQAQDIIKKYIKISGSGCRHATLASALGSLTWKEPLYSEFKTLERESEYAAWTFVNGYALNHVAIATHRLKSQLRNINNLNLFIEENGFKFNSEGGVVKVSPDGLLQQSSTVADPMPFQFSDGVTEQVPCSYIEFAERLVMPQYRNLPIQEVKEFHRRDGFEVGNADALFASTSREQLTRRAA